MLDRSHHANSTDPSPQTHDSQSDLRCCDPRRLEYGKEVSFFAIVCATPIFLVALYFFQSRLDGPLTLQEYFSHAAGIGFVFSQVILVYSVPCVLYHLGSRYALRSSRTLALVFIAAITTTVIANWMIIPIIGDHVFSSTAIKLLDAMGDHFSAFLSASTIAYSGIIGCLGMVALLVAWSMARRLSRRIYVMTPQLTRVIVVGLALCIVFSAFHLRNGLPALADSMRDVPLSQPLVLTGAVSPKVALKPTSTLELRGTAVVAANIQHLESQLDAYKQISCRAESADLPDVVFIMAECIRHDAMRPEWMPNFCKLAARGINTQNHYSGGNCSRFGFFSLLMGQDAYWFDRSAQIPMG